MKVTVNINIGGYAFHIDEDAYHELKAYLRSLELHFTGEEGASEIMADIEERMSELFRARLGTYRQVISSEDVREVMKIMGAPEDFVDQDSYSSEEKFTSASSRRMYRDPDNRMIGGVCSGMAAYWRLDPVIPRVIFLALIFAGGLGIFAYLILWIVLPEARTTAQKIEMKGDPVNVHNIKESVRQEFERVKKNFKK
ncbi:MAG: PspC domain-containing protein [Bacteroidales bacterium]|jgi:phage shock protein PspC (stress-responsive transcriptional regulator)|nr:PspC domain-containing protein [Bacteroidales bacterium]